MTPQTTILLNSVLASLALGAGIGTFICFMIHISWFHR